MHVDAVQNATEDAGFKLPTAEAKQALQAANHLITWFEQEDVQINIFILYPVFEIFFWNLDIDTTRNRGYSRTSMDSF